MTNDIPDIVIGRLPIYLRALSHLASENGSKLTTSSHELGKRLGISSAQIRKDLSHFGEFGKQGTGYTISHLIEQLQLILHLKLEWSVAVIGAGFLGHALAHYDGFLDRGFRISLIFDVDPKKIGRQMNGLLVQPISELKDSLSRENTKIGVIAVPAETAQNIADMLVDAGIKAILNYAPINLRVPDDVNVQNSDPVIQLQRMTYYLQEAKQELA